MPRRFSLKTRLLSLLLSAAMVLMFLPASAFAAADKQVLVGDTWLGSANRSVTCGDGTAEYDPDTQTLTLTKATINSGHAAAICNMTYGLTIKLVGENSINSDNQPGILSVQSCGLLTLTGEGSLNITAANGHAIYVNTGSLLVKDTTVKVSSDALAVYADLGIEISNSTFESASTDGNAIWTPRDLTIENSNVTTNSAGNFPAIWCDGDITINGGQLKSTCIGSDALGAAGTLSITNCNVENKGGYTALYSGGEMTLTGGSITAEAERNAIMSKSAMTITNATVKATAQKYNALRASDVMKIDKGRVEATTFGEETYAIHMEPMDDGNNGRMEIGGGVELYVNGYNGISVGEGATIEDARIVIDSEACSIDMPVKFADGYDIARALGGDALAYAVEIEAAGAQIGAGQAFPAQHSTVGAAAHRNFLRFQPGHAGGLAGGLY